MGLFDTVNSVPRFESAWMQRSKFPYTARSSAKVIRHAVSIDERRAKFRQDLIGEAQPQREDKTGQDMHRYNPVPLPRSEKPQLAEDESQSPVPDEGSEARGVHGSTSYERGRNQTRRQNPANPQRGTIQLTVPSQPGASSSSESLPGPVQTASTEPLHVNGDNRPENSGRLRRTWSESKQPQDIQEVWFAGGHADIGGGWMKQTCETWMLSHTPLVWMVHEAERAGLRFDPMYDVVSHPSDVGLKSTDVCLGR
jgi:uncharacterized protein (DUF2235 family)